MRSSFVLVLLCACLLPSLPASAVEGLYVEILEPPKPPIVQVGDEVKFNAVVSPTGTGFSPHAVKWLWDFGDGYGEEENPTAHAYQHGGLYPVTVTATFGKATGKADTCV